MKIKTMLFSVALVAAAVLAACGGGDGVSAPSNTGTLHVALTDAPACGFDEVNVTVSKIRVHQSGSATGADAEGGWSDITLNPAKKINLTDLTNGALQDLGQTALPVGRYTQLRLVLLPNSTSQPLNNSVKPTGGTETAVDTPSGSQSGFKLIHQFDVAPDTLVDLTLDFDACKSIVKKGNGGFSLKPVVSVIPVIVSGKISGFVDAASAGSNAVVYAQQGGKVIKSTVPTASGSFTLSPLQQSSTAGKYDVVMVADGRATVVIAGVPVTASGVTAVSASTSPTNLTTSAMGTVSGVATAAAEAVVGATQSLTGGSKIEVRSVAATLTTGAYALSLPTAAPLKGNYTTTLPIALTADAPLAGKYVMEATATTSAAIKTAAVTVSSTTPAVQNFTLP